MKISVKLLSPTAKMPTKTNPTDAGYDLYADEDTELYPGVTTLIRTGVAIAVPEGMVGLLWDRSGLGSKGYHRHGGVIDYGYTGDVSVAICNNNISGHLSIPKYQVKRGDRIAQIIFQDAKHFDLEEVEELDETGRSSSGFGSSGR
jgi:dUTP pyrophosphatase